MASRASSIQIKSVSSEPLTIELSLLIDQGFGIYIQEVCTDGNALEFFFISSILLQRTFFIVSWIVSILDPYQMSDATLVPPRHCLSFFFIVVKYFDILTS